MSGKSLQYWLCLPAGVFVILASLNGLMAPDFYRGSTAWNIQGQAQDFVDLVVVVPVLAVSTLLASRGSLRGRLVWLGVLTYLVYSFAIYSFAVTYNRMFLAYVAVLGCSLWALIGGMVATDWKEVGHRFGPGVGVKALSILLMVPAVLFYLLWLQEDVQALLAGEAPQTVRELGLTTNPVHVLDMAILLPAMALASRWLWRRAPMGFGLAGVMLVNMLLQNLGITTIMIFSFRAGMPGGSAQLGVFAAFSLVTLGALTWFLLRIKPPS